MNLIFKLFFILLAFYCGGSFAQFLQFPMEKNGIQIFPQRFEYRLIDKNKFAVGDILIDASKMDIQIKTTREKESRLRFRWPAGLIREGEILLKDNIGKALWSQKFTSNQISLSDDHEIESENSSYRTSLAVFETTDLDSEILKKIQNTAFFRLCVTKVDQETRIYLCSKDLFVKKVGKILTIQSRDSFRKESFVEINGRPVDPQGAIFLSERSDTINLRALLVSGATLDLFTRRKDVQFKDVVLSETGNNLTIRATGTEPVKEQVVKHLSKEDWEAQLDIDRPAVYLKGEGDIPLRQEFLIKNSVRRDSLQVKVKQGWTLRTYASEVNLEFEKLQTGIRLSSFQRGSNIQSNTNWTLSDLETGVLNKRYLNVENKDGKFVAAFEVYRGHSIDWRLRLGYPLFGQAAIQWWLPDLRNGLELQYNRLLFKADGDPDWSEYGFNYRFRFNSGLHLKDSSWGLGAAYDIATSTTNFNSLSLLLWGEQTSPDWLVRYFDWFRMQIKWPLNIQTKDGLIAKSNYDLEIALQRQVVGKYYFIETGLRQVSHKLESNLTNLSFSKTLIFVGLGGQF